MKIGRARGGKLRGGSQPKPAPDFLQRDIVARLRTGQIQLGRGLGIDDFPLTEFREKRRWPPAPQCPEGAFTSD
jgi:hypothetical protein